MQERKKRRKRGEEEDISYPLIISQLQFGDFGPFFGFLVTFFSRKSTPLVEDFLLDYRNYK
ncbi:MAG: hypothetical protein SPL12_06800 [Bacteroidales bacterium]|nr:hypothetical protein [Bacteroidales bacterium]